MNRIVSALIFFMCICIGSVPSVNCAETGAENKSPGKSLILTTPDSDGVLIRYADRVFLELGKRVDIDIKIKPLPKIRALVSANDGDFDGLANRVINLEKTYPNLRRVKVSHLAVQHILYAREKEIIDFVKDFKSLNDYFTKYGYIVAYLGGSAKAASELSRIPDKNKLALNSPEQGFEMLALGHIHAYLAGPGMANRVIFNRKYSHSKIQEVGVFSRFPLYPYLHVKHASLIPVLEKAIQSMLDDGTIEKIRESVEK